MTELTKEQIAQGWKLHDGRNCPFRTNNHLCEVIDFDGIMHVGYGVSDQYAWVHEYRGPSDEIEAYCVWAYRTFSPDVPGPSESDALEALECLHTYALKTAATHNQEMNEHMRVVRDVLASLPSPPVSGEVVELSKAANYLVGLWDTKRLFQDNPGMLNERSMQKLEQDIEWAISNLSEKAGEETYDGFDRPDVEALSPLTNKPVGQFDTSDYVIVGSDGKPRRNEPVGVTISRELAEDIHEALEDLGACPDDECTQCKHVLPRLSAAITGEKG